MRGIIGRKVGMTQLFDDKGDSVPVTVIRAGPCPVLAAKENGSVQLGFEETKVSKINKPRQGIFKKAGVPPVREIKEFQREPGEEIKPGQWIDVSIFKPGEKVNVTGKSKGKGFTGAVKRWGFSGGPKTHGQKNKYRSVGSIGASATPSRVWKGQKMPGRSGGKTITVKNLEVIKVEPTKALLVVKGAVSGAKNTILYINRSES